MTTPVALSVPRSDASSPLVAVEPSRVEELRRKYHRPLYQDWPEVVLDGLLSTRRLASTDVVVNPQTGNPALFLLIDRSTQSTVTQMTVGATPAEIAAAFPEVGLLRYYQP